MSADNYRWYLREVLDGVPKALPHQRAQDGFNHLTDVLHPAHKLVSIVGAAESTLRSIVVHHDIDDGQSYEEADLSRRLIGAEDLMRLVFDRQKTTPSEVFGDERWQTFKCAISYRDAIVHQCIQVRGDYCMQLMGVCAEVISAVLSQHQIPQPTAPAAAQGATATDIAPSSAAPATQSLDVLQVLKGMFEWSERMTTLLISAGYVGFLAAWTYMHEQMCTRTEFAVALLFVFSLMAFAFWHAFNILRINRAAFKFREKSKNPDLYESALLEFFDQIANPNKPFEKMWITKILPLTVITAMLGALIMSSAFIHGLLMEFGFAADVCR